MLIFCCSSIHHLSAQLYGKVLITGTKDPVKNAAVTITDTDSNKVIQSVKTSENGDFKLTVRARNYRIEVSKLFFETYVSPVYQNSLYERSAATPLVIYLKTSINVNAPVIDTPKGKVLIERKLKDQRIFRTKDAYDLIYALNPRLNPEQPIPSNYPLVMPKFPGSNRTIRKAFRKSHKTEVKADKKISAGFTNTIVAFSDQIQRFNTNDIRAASGVSNNDLFNLKSALTSVNSRLMAFKSKANKISKGTVTLMNNELIVLSKLLQTSINDKRMNSEILKKCNTLLFELNRFVELFTHTSIPGSLNEHYYYVKINGQGKQQHWVPVPASWQPSSSNIVDEVENDKQHTAAGLTYLSGPNDPRAFNIYVFILDPITHETRNKPEEKIFDLTYYPPGLEKELPMKPGNLPASMSTASIPPARFIFLIEDAVHHTKFVCEKFLDNETFRDESAGWSLFRKKPYKLIFYINTAQ